MSIQIAVRLPDDLVLALDELVAQGDAPSRTSVVEQALRRELRRHLYDREIALMKAGASDDDLDALADWNRRNFRMAD
jgi:metal-responsive CopG/Arc/MetJ family transcriptional regulator